MAGSATAASPVADGRDGRRTSGEGAPAQAPAPTHASLTAGFAGDGVDWDVRGAPAAHSGTVTGDGGSSLTPALARGERGGGAEVRETGREWGKGFRIAGLV